MANIKSAKAPSCPLGNIFVLILACLAQTYAAQRWDAVDSTFAPSGGVNAGGTIKAVAPQADGKVIVAGSFTSWDGQPRTNVVRLLADGALDTEFAAHHFAGFIPDTPGDIEDVTVTEDGSIYLAGSFQSMDGQSRYGVVKLTTSGAIDESFGFAPFGVFGGSRIGALPDNFTFHRAVGSLNGTAVGYIVLNSAGVHQPDYLTGFPYAFVNNEFASALKIGPDGKKYLGGYFGFRVGTKTIMRLMRFSANGALDPSFVPALQVSDQVQDILPLADGKVIVTGTFGSQNATLVRLNANGAIDFNMTRSQLAIADSRIYSDNIGGCYVAGPTQVHRVNPDGVPDANFIAQPTGALRNLSMDSQGRLLVFGPFIAFAGAGEPAVARPGLVRIFGNAGNVVEAKPVIISHPQGRTANLGENVSFSVNATGPNLRYQWWKDSAPLASQTTTTLNLNAITKDARGDYFAVVSNGGGSVTSQVARLTINLPPEPPVITQSPIGGTYFEGANAELTVTAQGDGTLFYTWFLNGAPVFDRAGSIEGANTPKLTLLKLTAASGGIYSVQVRNSVGTILSDPAELQICLPLIESTFNNRPWIKIVLAGDAVPGFANRFGPLRDGFEPIFTLRDKSIHFTARGDGLSASPATFQRGLFRWRDGLLSTLVWTNTPNPSGGVLDSVHYPTDEENGAVNFQSFSMFEIRNGVIREIISPTTPVPGRNGTFGGTGSFARRGDSVAISATVQSDVVGAGIFLYNGQTITRICDDTTDLPGVMSGYYGRLTEDSINFDGERIVFSTLNPIANQSGVYSSTVTGEITKLADSGDTLPGAADPMISFGDVDVEGGLVFAIITFRINNNPQNRLVAFDRNGAVVPLQSTPIQADYLVAAGPRQVYYGNSSQISRWTDGVVEVVANLNTVLECRKPKRFFDVEAQGDDISIGVEFADGTAGIFANFGQATTGAPRIIAPPQPQTVLETATAVFEVAASGAAPLSYQWFKNALPIAGADKPALILQRVSQSDAGAYSVRVFNASGEAVSTPVNLQVGPPVPFPMIHDQSPSAQTVVIGSDLQLFINASGPAPISYAWYKSGTLVETETGPTLRFPSVAIADRAPYTAVATTAGGSVTSSVMNFTITARITAQPASLTVPPGQEARFTVAATGFETYRYQWFKNFATIALQTNDTLVIPSSQLADAGQYYVQVTGVGGAPVRSSIATLTVDAGGGGPVEIRLTPASLVGGELRFTFATRNGTPYVIESKARLNDPTWSPVRSLTGNGQAEPVAIPASGASTFVRVRTGP